MTYAQKLSDPRWQRRRTEIYTRDGWRCVWCKDDTTNLQVDHKHYVRGREPWEYADADLQTLCKGCHGRVTELRRRASVALGEFSVFELPGVIAALEQMTGMEAAPSTPAPAQARRHDIGGDTNVEVPSRPVMGAADLAALEREKRILLAQPWTSEASLRVEELDEMTWLFWNAVSAEAA